jgi:hypothetical protein
VPPSVVYTRTYTGAQARARTCGFAGDDVRSLQAVQRLAEHPVGDYVLLTPARRRALDGFTATQATVRAILRGSRSR